METPDKAEIVCPKCSKEVAAGMEFCPFCGNKLKKGGKKSKIIKILLIIISIIFIRTCFNNLDEDVKKKKAIKTEQMGSVQNNPSESKSESKCIIDKKSFMNEFENNPIKADMKYKDKTIIVHGEIYDIGVLPLTGDPYVSLQSEKYNRVLCLIGKKRTNDLAKYDKNQYVYLQGVVEYNKMSMEPMLMKCEIFAGEQIDRSIPICR